MTSGGCAKLEEAVKNFGCRMHSACLQETCQGDLKRCLSRKYKREMSWEKTGDSGIRHPTPPQTMTAHYEGLSRVHKNVYCPTGSGCLKCQVESKHRENKSQVFIVELSRINSFIEYQSHGESSCPGSRG